MKNKKKIRLVAGICIIVLIVAVILLIMGNNTSSNRNENSSYHYENSKYFIGIGYDELNKKIKNKDNFLLCVSSTTCSHCAKFKPKLKSISEEYKIEIFYTDIDQYSKKDLEKFNETYNVDGTPTTLIFRDGKEVSIMSRIEGEVSKDKIVTILKRYEFIDE